jgi:hypothetical protein
LEVIASGGQVACELALAYVAVNTKEITTLDDSGCASAFSSTCTPGQALTLVSGRYTITVTHPVSDAHDLMTSGIVGATSQPLDSDDGAACERVAVEMRSSRESMFAQLLGFDQGVTTVHTVARATTGDEDPPINLLVLDRTACEAIKVRGGGGIIVDARIDVDEAGNPVGLLPGFIAADSDGSAGCTSVGVISVEGSTALLRADGPDCPEQSGSHPIGSFTAYEGCGRIQVYAPGTPGCAKTVNLPACSPGSGGSNPPKPAPTALAQPFTREKADHRYNCWSDYTLPPAGTSWAALPLTGDQSIGGCDTGEPDHIYDLIKDVGPVTNGKPTNRGLWKYWNADLGRPCTVTGSAITVTKNVVVDCPNFTVKSRVQITGDVVFNGNVTVTSSTGDLRINHTLASPGWAFFRGGTLTKDAQAKLAFNYTSVYMSRTSRVAMSGGSGSLTWIAPDSDEFDDLALWSDSPLDHNWAGQAALNMEGVFFMPLAKAIYTGSSGQNQTNAQWIADKLEAAGGGQLVVRPAADRGISFGGPASTLIR